MVPNQDTTMTVNKFQHLPYRLPQILPPHLLSILLFILNSNHLRSSLHASVFYFSHTHFGLHKLHLTYFVDPD